MAVKLEETYSTREAAAYLGVEWRTIKFYLYDIPEALRLKPDKTVGRALLFTRQTLDKFKAKYEAEKRQPGHPPNPNRALTRKRGKLHEPEVQALELLSIEDQPLGSEFEPGFELLVLRRFAVRTEDGYQITEKGCDWLSKNVAASSIPTHNAPCGWTRTD